MAIYQLCVSGQPIIDGLAVVGNGVPSKPLSYNATQRNVSFKDLDSIEQVKDLATRYIYHGGVGGSGAWEK